MRKYLTGEIGNIRLGPQPETFLQDAARLLRPGAVYRLEVPPELCWGAAATHPATAYRYLVLRKTVREINAKIAAGRPLTPNRVRTLAANDVTG